jgi:hypothetical protein
MGIAAVDIFSFTQLKPGKRGELVMKKWTKAALALMICVALTLTAQISVFAAAYSSLKSGTAAARAR